MSRLIPALGLALVLGIFSVFSVTKLTIESARAQGAASVSVVDAGVQATSPDAGVGVGALPDLGEPDSGDVQVIVRTVHEVKEREGLWAAVIAGAFLILKLLQMAPWAFVAFLKRGKMPAVISSAIGLLGAGFDYITGNVTGFAIIGAAMMAVTTLVNAFYTPPAPKSP